MARMPIKFSYLWLFIFVSGCVFYNTYPTYNELRDEDNVKASVDFTGDIFKKEFRSRGNTFGSVYSNTYFGHTKTISYEWQDPKAEYFKDRFESVGISVRAPNPQYTVDVKKYCNGEQYS